MSKPKVWITRPISPDGLHELAAKCELTISEKAPSAEEVQEKIGNFDALLISGTPITEQHLAVAKNLKIISNHGVGYNNVDVQAAIKHGILVTNTPYDVTEATADLAFTLLMCSGRRVAEADRLLRAGADLEWGPMLLNGQDIYGKTLGIIGLGRIGRAMARRASGFNMEIIYYDVFRQYEAENAIPAKYCSFDEVLKQADYLTLHMPLTPESKHLISKRELEMMKSSAYLINASRGPVVDEKALVEALKNKTIAGAGLDVFEREPILEPGLTECDNVVMTPHIGTSAKDTRKQMALTASQNILAVLAGETPPFLVPECCK